LHMLGDVFSEQQKARNFAYYEALTARDSSLSACTQPVIAAEVGHLELAHDYFGEAVLMDLNNLEHNNRDGLHIASLAGAWIVAVAGFGGMRHHDGTLSFTPHLPERLTRLAFGVCFPRTAAKSRGQASPGPLRAAAGTAARDHPSRPGDHHQRGEPVSCPVPEAKAGAPITLGPKPGTAPTRWVT
jgi:trehalose/maltose hydrolase-like predicted phosphorylase